MSCMFGPKKTKIRIIKNPHWYSHPLSQKRFIQPCLVFFLLDIFTQPFTTNWPQVSWPGGFLLYQEHRTWGCQAFLWKAISLLLRHSCFDEFKNNSRSIRRMIYIGKKSNLFFKKIKIFIHGEVPFFFLFNKVAPLMFSFLALSLFFFFSLQSSNF